MIAAVSIMGVACALGVVGLLVTLVPSTSGGGSTRSSDGGVRAPLRQSIIRRGRFARAGAGVAAGLLVVGVTRWPVAGVFTMVAVMILPGVLRRSDPRCTARRAEAVAGWTELIRDSLVASAGLAQALVTVATSAPLDIRPHASALATRLVNGVPPERALRTFAAEVDDPAADFVVCALLLAASSRTQRLADVLSALAESIREDVAMRLRVEASRSSARSSVRTIVLFSLGFAALLAMAARSYLAPFDTAMGQVVLVGVGLFYAGGLGLMVRMVRPAPAVRLVQVGHLE